MRKDAKVLVTAAEVSGDLHAAHLVTALRALHPDWRFFGLGGPRMEAAGVALREDLVENAVMGFLPVVKELGRLLRTVARFEEELRTDPPDLLVVVDSPGLNLELAALARRHGIPVVYYICPQVWAWAPWRLRRVAKRADLLLTILPFEEELYRGVHPNVRYVGNPVFDHLSFLEESGALGGAGPLVRPDERCLALLPGSRRQEVRSTLPAQLRVAAELRRIDPRLTSIISCQRDSLAETVDRVVAEGPVEARVHRGPVAELQAAADLALVCSGTATLEQAWFGTPMVVHYPMSEVDRALYRAFAVMPHFALVNLFAGREVVPEVLYSPGEEEEILRRARPLVAGPERERVREELRRLREDRFRPGAAARAAEEVAAFARGIDSSRPTAPLLS